MNKIEYMREWRKKNKERIRAYRKVYRSTEKYKEYSRIDGRLRARRKRIEVLLHYSNGSPKCACCGETENKFLTIDHINNDGYKTYKRGRRAAGTELYRLIRKSNYPEGFQVLCFNCNCSKGAYGQCPHITK